MGEARGWTYGLAVGAGLMFVLDPRQGGGRRALIRDKSVRAVHEVEHAAKIGVKDFGHRAEGVVARLFGGTHAPVSDVTLVERVRARLGHVCSHPHAIEVRAKGNGEIELKGPVEADEADRMVAAISRVPGVHGIDDDLQRAPHLPGHPRPKVEPIQQLWNPTTRLALGVASLGVAVSGLVRGNPLSFGLGAASVLALARNMVTRGGIAGAATQMKALARGAQAVAQGDLSQVKQTVAGALGAVGPDGKPITGLREAYPTESEWNAPNTRPEQGGEPRTSGELRER